MKFFLFLALIVNSLLGLDFRELSDLRHLNHKILRKQIKALSSDQLNTLLKLSDNWKNEELDKLLKVTNFYKIKLKILPSRLQEKILIWAINKGSENNWLTQVLNMERLNFLLENIVDTQNNNTEFIFKVYSEISLKFSEYNLQKFMNKCSPKVLDDFYQYIFSSKNRKCLKLMENVSNSQLKVLIGKIMEWGNDKLKLTGIKNIKGYLSSSKLSSLIQSLSVNLLFDFYGFANQVYDDEYELFRFYFKSLTNDKFKDLIEYGLDKWDQESRIKFLDAMFEIFPKWRFQYKITLLSIESLKIISTYALSKESLDFSDYLKYIPLEKLGMLEVDSNFAFMVKRIKGEEVYTSGQDYCQICVKEVVNCFFSCSHGTCQKCADKIMKYSKKCPYCRKMIEI